MRKAVNLNIYFPEEEIDNQWIIDLIGCIKFSAQKVLEPERKCNVYSVDLQAFAINNLKSHDYHIIILGSESNDNEQYQKVLGELCSSIFAEGSNSKSLSKIFKILLKPNNQITQPEFLVPYIGYELFTFSPRGNTTKLFEISSQDTDSWAKVLDIVYDLKQTIFSLEDNFQPNFTYMADCTNDQKSNYYDIKRELQHFNLTVLPLLSLPQNEEQMKLAVENNLNECNLIIQIIGGKYGEIKKGRKISDFEKENNIIKDFLTNHPDTYRLIWKPADLKITDPRQNLFLSRLSKEGIDKNSRIIESNIEEFKDIIAQFISNKNKRYLPYQNEPKVYLMSKETKINNNLEDVCSKLKLQLVKEIEIENNNFYLDHLEQLKTANSLIIEYTDNSEAWLYSKLGDIIKVIGIGRDIPLNVVVIIGENIPSINEYQKWLPNIEIANINDKDKIEALLTNSGR